MTGGTSFEVAVPLEPGRTYRLGEHLARGETAYFYVDAPAGRVLQVTLRTGTKGLVTERDGMAQETDAPYAGIALADTERHMIGQRQDIMGRPMARVRLQVRPTGKMGQRVYLLIGSRDQAQHRDGELTIASVGDR